MAAEQGRTFSNSTLAATYNALYKEDYSQIIDYCMNVMRDTPNILMIVYSNRNGEEIIMTRDKWMTKNKSLPYYKMHFAHDNTALIGKRPYQITSNSTLLSPTKHFEFSTPIAISFREWGGINGELFKRCLLFYCKELLLDGDYFHHLVLLAFTISILCFVQPYSTSTQHLYQHH